MEIRQVNDVSTSYLSTVPIYQMENEIIRLNQKGFVVIKSEIIDGNIKLYAMQRREYLRTDKR